LKVLQKKKGENVTILAKLGSTLPPVFPKIPTNDRANVILMTTDDVVENRLCTTHCHFTSFIMLQF